MRSRPWADILLLVLAHAYCPALSVLPALHAADVTLKPTRSRSLSGSQRAFCQQDLACLYLVSRPRGQTYYCKYSLSEKSQICDEVTFSDCPLASVMELEGRIYSRRSKEMRAGYNTRVAYYEWSTVLILCLVITSLYLITIDSNWRWGP